jgi:glutathione S-transferase
MITLYSSGPMFGLPHPNPFVIKADVLLKMFGLEYRAAPMTFGGAPKGKVPYISDDGLVLGDKICGADASVFGSLYSASSSYFNTGLGAYIRSQPKIMAYLERMRTRFFPEGADAKA